MGKDPKSLSQAQKKAIKDERNAEKAQLREEENVLKRTFYAQQFGSKSSSKNNAPDSDDNSEEEKPQIKKEKNPWEHSSEEDEEEIEEEDSEGTPVADDASSNTTTEHRHRDAHQSRIEVAEIRKEVHEAKVHQMGVVVLAPASEARIVTNHSSYIQDLQGVLRRLSRKLDSGCTIQAGSISNSGSQRRRDQTVMLSIKPQLGDASVGLARYIAHCGDDTQEFTVVYSQRRTKEEIDNLVQECMTVPTHTQREASWSLGGPVVSNRDLAQTVDREGVMARKKQHQAQHQEHVEAERNAKQAKAEADRARSLQSKVGKSQAMAYAERDEAIVSGKSRGKKSMK